MTKAEQPTITQADKELLEALQCVTTSGFMGSYIMEVEGLEIIARHRTTSLAAQSEITPEWCLNMAKREGDSDIGAGLLAMDPAPSLAAQLDKQAVADAVDEAETSLLVWTDAAWNGQIAGDARDFCRAQYGRFKQLREDLGLPAYKRPEFQERDLTHRSSLTSAQDGDAEHIVREIIAKHYPDYKDSYQGRRLTIGMEAYAKGWHNGLHDRDTMNKEEDAFRAAQDGLVEALQEIGRLAETLCEYDGEVCNIAEYILSAQRTALSAIKGDKS